MNKRVKKGIIFLLIGFICILALSLVLLKKERVHTIDNFDQIKYSLNFIDNNTTHKIFPEHRTKKFLLSDVINKEINNKYLLVGENGKVIISKDYGYFKFDRNRFHYVYNDGVFNNVVGVFNNHQLPCITKAYYDSIKYINQGKVLLILVDGFGFHQYQWAIKEKIIDNLNNYNNIMKVTSVFKPVTNAGMAAIITGKTPNINGVHNREYKDIECPSVFRYMIDNNKASVFIEGNIKILNTEIEPELNIDNNDNGTDDEVYKCTLKKIEQNKYEFIMTHFHGIDDAGHKYGDLSDETMKVINIIDGYIGELVNIWDGTVIITSDHGMHSTKTGGEHGEFLNEDMFVPYIVITKGGKVLKKSILPIVIVVLIVIVGLGGFINRNNIMRKKEMIENAQFNIVLNEQVVASFDIARLKTIEEKKFKANLKTSGKPGVTHSFTGTPLISILEELNIDLVGKKSIISKAVDGYSVAYSIEEVKEKNNIYITYAMDEETLGTKDSGGRGPLMLVVRKDPFSQRWCKYLIEVAIK